MKTSYLFYFFVTGLIFLISLLTIEKPKIKCPGIGYGFFPSFTNAGNTLSEGENNYLPSFHHNKITKSSYVHMRSGKSIWAIPEEDEILEITPSFTYSLGDAYISGVEGSLRQETALTITA